MKRKLIAVLLLIAVIPVSLMATPFLQIGPLVSYNRTVVELEEDDFWALNNFSFGADVRINPIKYLSIDIPATIGFGDDFAVSIAAIPTINGNIPIGNILDISLGLGTQFDFQYTGRTNDSWTMNGLPMENAGDAFQHSKLVYRAGVTVNLAAISIGINALVPGQAGFGDNDIGGVFNPMWESTRFSVVALFNLF